MGGVVPLPLLFGLFIKATICRVRGTGGVVQESLVDAAGRPGRPVENRGVKSTQPVRVLFVLLVGRLIVLIFEILSLLYKQHSKGARVKEMKRKRSQFLAVVEGKRR